MAASMKGDSPEPVWAIGKGETFPNQPLHKFILIINQKYTKLSVT